MRSVLGAGSVVLVLKEVVATDDVVVDSAVEVLKVVVGAVEVVVCCAVEVPDCKLNVCMIVDVEHELERIVISLSNCIFNISKNILNDCIVSITDCSVKVALSIIRRTSCTNFTSSYVLYKIVSQSK